MGCEYCKDLYNWEQAVSIHTIPKVYQLRMFGNERIEPTALIHQRRWFGANYNYVLCGGGKIA